ncbi:MULTISPECIES: bifunctional RNase H/acid phosphatase [unclassified Streptomyces]|uniref:bifunctional RNase H/acid phosphatase n=1 Tax=unclassified Streptomyces TaxID=2593676 RepID=UPI0008DDC7C3|nr:MULTISPECIES: bifunctional RNase H/acid phosphatase [unclassified Streptomyces]OII68392.1 bifunctional RNase H/acid phosphatase [Streptomyces sp. CC77]
MTGTQQPQELVVEADGGSRGNPGPAGYGAVVLDPVSGEPLAETAEYIGVATNNVAEYRGLVAGLRAARALAPDASVRVRMDSKLVVEQMSGRWKIKHPDMKPLAAEAARVFPPGRVTYEWIPRERNKHADRLANEAMDAGRRGAQWQPSTSRAQLDAGAARVVGDAAAGAAKARAALAGAAAASSAAPPAERPEPPTAPPSEAASDAAARARTEPAGPSTAGSAASDVTAAPDGTAAAPDGTAAASDGTAKATTVGWGSSADLGAPALFVLLRHGETALTPEKRFSGSGGSDPELSPVGLRQAEAAADLLAARGTVQDIVASPLLRCRQTAAVVADRLGLDVRIDDGLREADFGAWEGLTFAEVQERHPDDLAAWLASPKAPPTGGESFAAVSRRIAATRDRLTERHAGRTVLLVTHVAPIKTLVRLALGAPPEALFRMELSAASFSAIAYYRDGNTSVRLLNDTSHLR